MISIELDLAEDLKAVSADPSQIEQVLMNLTINAKDAMPKGGKLLVTTRNVYLSQGDGELHMDFVPGRYLLMRVNDTGEGMDKKTLDRMFEPFYTTKGIGRGTGLGLSMVYGIIKNHNGFINCSSEIGKGTTFEIYLPALEFQESKSNEVVSKTQLRGTETLLVIDDEDFIRNLVQEIFSNFGYTILKAADLKQAMEILGEHPVDLVLLDLMMPEVSGTECLKELLRNDPSLKVVIASGYVPDSSTRKTLEKYARAFVNKPYNAKQMLQVIRQVLDGECPQVESGNGSMPG
jgi:CheY-like chemotaxis protein